MQYKGTSNKQNMDHNFFLKEGNKWVTIKFFKGKKEIGLSTKYNE